MPDKIKVLAVAGYEHELKTLSGEGRQYFRIDDKKSYDKVTEDSKYNLVSVSAKAIIVLTVGKKHNKYSVTSMDYEDDEKWADAIRRLFSKKLFSKIDEDEFLAQYMLFIRDNVEKGTVLEGDEE